MSGIRVYPTNSIMQIHIYIQPDFSSISRRLANDLTYIVTEHAAFWSCLSSCRETLLILVLLCIFRVLVPSPGREPPGRVHILNNPAVLLCIFGVLVSSPGRKLAGRVHVLSNSAVLLCTSTFSREGTRRPLHFGALSSLKKSYWSWVACMAAAAAAGCAGSERRSGTDTTVPRFTWTLYGFGRVQRGRAVPPEKTPSLRPSSAATWRASVKCGQMFHSLQWVPRLAANWGCSSVYRADGMVADNRSITTVPGQRDRELALLAC